MYTHTHLTFIEVLEDSQMSHGKTIKYIDMNSCLHLEKISTQSMDDCMGGCW